MGLSDAQPLPFQSRFHFASLPIDEKTGKLLLPPHVSTVVIDVGAGPIGARVDSDYLKALTETKDATTAIILFEPLPENHDKLKEAIKAANLQNQAFLAQAALGESEYEANFNVATGPSCGSLLGEGKYDFWCTRQRKQ